MLVYMTRLVSTPVPIFSPLRICGLPQDPLIMKLLYIKWMKSCSVWVDLWRILWCDAVDGVFFFFLGGEWCETLWILCTTYQLVMISTICSCHLFLQVLGELQRRAEVGFLRKRSLQGLGWTDSVEPPVDSTTGASSTHRTEAWCFVNISWNQSWPETFLLLAILRQWEKNPCFAVQKGRLFGKTMELSMDKWLDAMVNAQVASSLDFYQKIGGLSGSSWCFKEEWHHDFIWFFDALELGFLNEARRLASENALVRVLVDLWREVPSQQYGGTQLAAGSSSRMVDVSTVMRRIQVSNSLWAERRCRPSLGRDVQTLLREKKTCRASTG